MLCCLSTRGGSWDFCGFGGAEARRALLCFGFPIGTPEAFRGGQIPSSRIRSIATGFKVTSQFERHHGVARLRK